MRLQFLQSFITGHVGINACQHNLILVIDDTRLAQQRLPEAEFQSRRGLRIGFQKNRIVVLMTNRLTNLEFAAGFGTTSEATQRIHFVVDKAIGIVTSRQCAANRVVEVVVFRIKECAPVECRFLLMHNRVLHFRISLQHLNLWRMSQSLLHECCDFDGEGT